MLPRIAVGCALTLVLGAVVVPATAATGSARPAVESTPQSTVVNPVPANYTPDVTDGIVYSIAQVGSDVVLGGSFTSIAPHGSSVTRSADGVAEFNAGTGALVSGFAPTINGGTVKAVLPGPTSSTVYVGGEFTSIDGVSTKLALLNINTGAIASGWTSPTFDGNVNSLVREGGKLFVGGEFSSVGSQSRVGLVVLDSSTGALSSYAVPDFSGHHNYNVNCNPSTASCAQGPTGIRAMDISPDGNQLVAIGNFTDVSGADRDQIARLDVGNSAATVDSSWASDAYTSACDSSLFDSYVRDVQFSPDGSYFVVAATGAGGQVKNSDGTQSNCDAASRFDSDSSGDDVRPAWVDHTGNDTFLSVALTGTAVYLGGHERWVNNSTGVDSPKEGAVPRPGIVALDPINGLPLKWNPGRNPRGSGAWALLATNNGLYVGSDTDYIGDHLYLRRKIAFFPLAGGAKLASNSTHSLPGDVVMLGVGTGNTESHKVTWDGATTPTTPTTASSGIDWSTARGAFEVNSDVYYGTTGGNFYRRSYSGTAFGPAISIDPYDDPNWDNVQTGSGQTYRGTESNFYAEIPDLTSTFYSAGRVFYTLSSDSHLYWRWFEPDSGTVGADEFTATSSVDWSDIAGAFLSGNNLYFADGSTGDLEEVNFDGDGTSGVATTADSSIDWRSQGDFVAAASQTTTNEPPTADFSASCDHLACSFSTDGSTDPDGTIADYSWDWGDGTSSSDTATPTSHTYTNTGNFVVTLTVTDNDGAQTSISKRVQAVAPPEPSYVAARTVDGTVRSQAVTVPKQIDAGDTLLLFASTATKTGVAKPPHGWSPIATDDGHHLSTTVFSRTARAADAGRSVKVRFGSAVNESVTVAAYSGAAKAIESTAVANDHETKLHTSAALADLAAGTLVVTYWSDRSTVVTHWKKPDKTALRVKTPSHGNDEVGSLLVDPHRAVIGFNGGVTARTTKKVAATIVASIALAPAG